MVDLELFEDRDAHVVAGWAGDREASMMWCSLPSVSAETVSSWSTSSSVEAFVLRDQSRVVGYGEIWVDTDATEVEVAHLIVDPAERGAGHGTTLVRGLVDQARRHYPFVALRVHSQNDVAIRCYAAADFERVSEAEETAWNVGQSVSYVWMTHHRR